MKATVKWWSGLEPFRLAAQSTLQPGQVSTVPFGRMLAAEHSPARCVRFIIVLEGIPTFVSTHLVRHKIGVEHFVQSNRLDRNGGNDAVNRMTPVTHTLDIDAQALINISRKRLCSKASAETRQVWDIVRGAILNFSVNETTDLAEQKAISDIYGLMVPECVYRGFCPELSSCSAGPARVQDRFEQWPGVRAENVC